MFVKGCGNDCYQCLLYTAASLKKTPTTTLNSAQQPDTQNNTMIRNPYQGQRVVAH